MNLREAWREIPAVRPVFLAWGVSASAALLLLAVEGASLVPLTWAGGCIALPLLWLTENKAVRGSALVAMAGLGLFSCLAMTAIVRDGRWDTRDRAALALAAATAAATILTLAVTWRSRRRHQPMTSPSPRSGERIIEQRPDSGQSRDPAYVEPLPKVFISYRRDDSQATTDRIFEHLAAAFPRHHLFRDIDSIPKGVDFRQWIDRSVAQCDVLLAIIGPQWLSVADESDTPRLGNPADYVRLEIEAALRRDIPLIPVTIANGCMPKGEALPESLRALAYRNGTTVRHDPDFANDMQRLIADLRAAAGGAARAAQEPPR